MEEDTSSRTDSLPHSDSNASFDNVELDEPQGPALNSHNEEHVPEHSVEEISVSNDPVHPPTEEETTALPVDDAQISEVVAAEPDSEPIIAPPIPPKEENKVEEHKRHKPTPQLSETSNGSRPELRSESPALSITNGGSTNPHKRSLTISAKGHNVSMVLITSALETIAASKEARKSVPLRESTQKALDLIRSNQGGDRPREIFEPLRLACETRNEKLMIASLDCISKLISYSFFAEEDRLGSYALPSPPPSPNPRNPSGASQANIPLPSLVDLVAHTITACHTETTPDPVSLQIVKALLSLVLSPNILVHHSSLLKAVRTVYNIFLLSTDPVNQMVAQGGLTQMVHHVFTRCKRGNSSAEASQTDLNGQSQPSSTRASFALPRSEPDSQPPPHHDNSQETGQPDPPLQTAEEVEPASTSDDKEDHRPLSL